MAMTISSMRDEFDRVLKFYGHDILLQKRIQDTDLDSAEFDNILERHTVRHMLPATRALPATRQEKKEGVLSTSERIYYFRYSADPFEGDRIYEYDISTVRTEDKRITFIIDQALPMRGEGGTIVYWMVGATRETTN